MKDILFGLLVLALVGTGAIAFVEYNEARNLGFKLKMEKAIAATGPCGTRFTVVGLGEDKNLAAVAGQIYKAEEVGRFFQKEEVVNGREYIAIYEITYNPAGNNFIFRRPKQ